MQYNLIKTLFIIRIIGLMLILSTGGATGMIMYFGADLIMPDPPENDAPMDDDGTEKD